MIRNYIIILVALVVTACDRPGSGVLRSETFTLPNGPGNFSDAVAGHAAAGLAYAAIRKQREENSPYAPWAPLLRSDHAELTDDQWIRFCFEQIFQRLGYSFEAMPGSGIRFDASTYTYTVTHTPEALAAYQTLLEDNNRTPAERWNELRNGGKTQGEQGVGGQPATLPRVGD